MTDIDVFLPSEQLASVIDRGSGVVGTTGAAGRYTLDYEGNRFGASNVVTFADRVSVAAGRHLEKYPTVARASVPLDEVLRVGTFDTETGVVDLGAGDVGEDEARHLVAQWCGLAASELSSELETTAHRDVLRRSGRGQGNGRPGHLGRP
jgi:hypothetical protein